jgi:LysM repeat protein
MIYSRDLTKPYSTLEHEGIAYSVCREFNNISRYRTLRQVVHSPNSVNRYVTLETSNPFVTHTDVIYHDVTVDEENRLDIIAQRYLGSATYGWVIAYFNQIADGYTVLEGQKLKIPTSVTKLFDSGEILEPRTALVLNLGEE